MSLGNMLRELLFVTLKAASLLTATSTSYQFIKKGI